MRFPLATGLLLATALWATDHNPDNPCALSGRLVSAATGEPLQKAQITLSHAADSSYAATTDDRGGFCLAADEAGTYELVIQKNGFVQQGQTLTFATGQTRAGILVRMVPQGVIAGRVTDRDGDPIPGATVQAIESHPAGTGRRYAVAASGTTNDLGEYRIFGLTPGRYYLSGAYHGETGYAAAYYPDVAEATSAVPVDVPAGGVLHGLNLTLPDSNSMRIRGVVEGIAGVPVAGITVVAVPCDAGPLNRATTTVLKSDGAFELRDLTPGCYVLAADTFNRGRRYSARWPLTLARQNVEVVKLSLAPPVQLTGRVHIENGGDVALGRVIVNLEARFSKLTAGGAAAEDGSLLLTNIVPEVYGLNVVVPEGYYLKSASYGQRNVLNSALDLSQGATDNLALEIAADGGRIEGAVVDGEDRPVEAVRIALVPDDPGGGPSRQKTTVSDATGAFHLAGIAPGNYHIYAAASLDVSALHDPGYLKLLAPYANSVAVVAHGAERVQVKAITDAIFGK